MSYELTDKLHNRVIDFSEIQTILPKRDRFLDKTLYEKIGQDIKKGAPLMFMPNSLDENKHMQDEKYAKSTYKITLFGILEDGRRATVILNNIFPYFEIGIPDDINQSKEITKFADEIMEKITMDRTNYPDYIKVVGGEEQSFKSNTFKIEPEREYEIIEGKPFKYYQKHTSKFLRIYFKKSMHRKDAIKYIRALGYKTYSDDLSCYYRVVCRDYKTTFSAWCVLDKYTVDMENQYAKGLVISVDIDNYKKYIIPEDNTVIAEHIRKDSMITMAWDIETYNTLDDGDIPMPENPNHTMFMIGITFQFYHSQKQLLRICLVDYPTEPHPDFITVVCHNEENLIRAFAICFDKMRPEIIMGFNDANYDWKWIMERAKKYDGLIQFIGGKFDQSNPKDEDGHDYNTVLYNYKKFETKITADLIVGGYNLQMNGYIPLDVMVIFKKLYPTSEKSSLSYFLSANKLGGKADMPYQEMFRIYKDNHRFNTEPKLKEKYPEQYLELKQKLKLVGEYCVVDSQRCHELLKIRMVISENREVSDLAFVSYYDAFYRAGGMKVRNMVIGRGQDYGYRFSNISNTTKEVGKYPGAYVFPPIKGLVSSKLNIEERIKKANMGYTEMAEWQNITPEQIEQMKQLISEHGAILSNPKLDEIEEKESISIPNPIRTFLNENIGRPITGLDFSSLYPSIIMAYNFSPEYIILNQKEAKKLVAEGHTLHKIKFEYNERTIKGWAIGHENNIDPDKPGYKFGVFPKILLELFNARKQIKKKMHPWTVEREQLLKLSNEELNAPDMKARYEEVCFECNILNSKQGALKVFMNTFYGETGNQLSSLFVIQIAGGITSAGQRLLKSAHALVEDKGCKVYYGDSVSADTPILIRYPDGTVDVRTIDDIPMDAQGWQDYPQFKINLETGQDTLNADGTLERINKQQHYTQGLETWTANGWKPIRRVIRHKTNKRMFRINTHMGCIDVTEDHSLLRADKTELKSKDAQIGDELFHSFPNATDLHTFPDMIKKSKRDSILGKIKVKSKLDAQIVVLQKIKHYNKIIGCGGAWCLVKYDEINDSYILNDTHNHKYCDSKIVELKPIPNEITQIIELPKITQDEFVYDIETEDGTFLGGVGSIVEFNTDSLYVCTPEEYFAEDDKLFYSGQITKHDYWTRMVSTTFKEIPAIQKCVNDWFKQDNGSDFLKMAYEEILYPVIFLSKKKYTGLAHEEDINFNHMRMPFIRGLEMKKRGVSELVKHVSTDFLQRVFNMENVQTIIEIVHDLINELYTREWTADDFHFFIKTAMYKPNKNNVSVHTFKDRIKLSRNIDLVPGDRFEYIISKKYPFKYDHRGRKIALSVGDKMELAEIAKAENIPIDVDYYMTSGVSGQLARFISYHQQFIGSTEGLDLSEAADLKKYEEDIYKSACKYIKTYNAKYLGTYTNKGEIHKKIFKKTSTILNSEFMNRYQGAGMGVMTIFNANCQIDELKDWLETKIIKAVEKKYKNYGNMYINYLLKRVDPENRKQWIKDMLKTYYDKYNPYNISKLVDKNYTQRKQVLELILYDNIKNIQKLVSINNTMITEISDKIKKVLDLDNKMTEIDVSYDIDEEINTLDSIDDDYLRDKTIESMDKMLANVDFLDILNNIKLLYVNLFSNYTYYYKKNSILFYLKELRDKQLKIIKCPDNNQLKKITETSLENFEIIPDFT